MGAERNAFDKAELTYSNSKASVSDCVTDNNRNGSLNGFKKLFLLILAFCTVFIFRANVIDRVVVQGNSMNPTYNNGDVMWAKKFDITRLKRNQVVVVKIDGGLFIKRVIGLPNENIKIEDGYVYINGERLSNDYGYKTKVYGKAIESISIGENEYFLMGDNRDNSLDSREWGAVSIDKIQSIVVYKFFPYFENISETARE